MTHWISPPAKFPSARYRFPALVSRLTLQFQCRAANVEAKPLAKPITLGGSVKVDDVIRVYGDHLPGDLGRGALKGTNQGNR